MTKAAASSNTEPRLRLPAAVWCAALHVAVSGMLLQWGAPPLWLADLGTWIAIGCCLLVSCQRLFLYSALPLLLMASVGLALQRAPRPHTVELVEARPVQLTARLREWHAREDQ
ncbi:MAG: hypothetical protein ACYSU1_02425, partial [Planctomycetota bacterium]